MKTKMYIVIAITATLASCNSGKEQKLEALTSQDSLLLAQAHIKDSTIASYINTMTDIQDNLDSIKKRENIIAMNSSENKTADQSKLMTDLKSIDDFILNNDRKLNDLAAKVKKLDRKDMRLEKLVKNLNNELAEKDQEIAVLQARLSHESDSLQVVSHRFTDSMVVIRRQREEVYALTDEVNTVYYVTGTMKELKDKGTIDKEGGFIGLGGRAELNPNLVNSSFTKAIKISLSTIPLNGKFRRLITEHPDKSYVISHNGNEDELVIKNPSEFWMESKYLVVATK